MSILIAAPGWNEAAWRSRLLDLLPSHGVAMLGEPFDRAAVRYALSWSHPPGALDDLPNLQVIFSLGAGVDHLFVDPLLPGAPIVRVVDADLRDRMSEWVVMHALIHLRRLRRYERQQQERLWADDDEQPKAADVEVGVLGLGALGMDAATKLKTMGFNVAGWSATPKAAAGIASFLRRRRPEAPAGAVRYARCPVAVDADDARAVERLAFRANEAGRAARRPGPDQRRPRRPAGRDRHSRRARFRRPRGRFARRVRARAAARRVAPMDASRRLCQPAQRRHLGARRGRRGDRQANRGL